MSWSVIVNGIQDIEYLPAETAELFSSLHVAYPRDAQVALDLARALGLQSATLSGGRTVNPYGGDEIVDVAMRGTTVSRDFIKEMQAIISAGPGKESDMARHYAALARLRENPCSHVWDEPISSGVHHCMGCGVYLNGTLFYFEDETDGIHAQNSGELPPDITTTRETMWDMCYVP